MHNNMLFLKQRGFFCLTLETIGKKDTMWVDNSVYVCMQQVNEHNKKQMITERKERPKANQNMHIAPTSK